MELKGNDLYYGDRTSVSIGGAIYYSQRSSHIFAIDVSDETSHFIQVPNEFVRNFCRFLELRICVVKHQPKVHVCILKDLYRGEWAELYKIKEAIDG